ncbi:MAG: arylsulfatase [Acidimicrobiia bacterium]
MASARSYPDFDGTVGRTFAGSQGWWPERPTPAPGAPNVVVILADDLGYSDLGCYGSEIETPNLDALAARGMRYTNFHVAPMCSPTRAALLTGVNPHRAGVGTVAHSDAGFPGYAMELATDVATAAEVFRDHGYGTMMLGKWHLTKDSDCSAAGPKHSWPCQRGFESFYGFLDAFTNQHHPHRLVEDNTLVEVDQYPEGYFLTDDLTDRAISMMRERKASNPEQPIFCYFAHGSVHAPLHAKEADLAKYRDRYREGWDRIRESRWRRQQELGVIPEGLPLPPRNSEPNNEVLPWDDLSETEQELFARHMAVYAAMADNLDQSVGRIVEALDQLGELDNTIILFTSDNGASREGEVMGTSAYYVHLLQGDDLDSDAARIDELGGPTTTPHYPRGWAMAGNTPFRLYKINTHAGGHSVPCILSWPAGEIGDGSFRRQYQHVTDVLPTLLDLCGLDMPSTRGGVSLAAPAGASFVSTLADADRPSTHPEQVTEQIGHRGYYRDGWEVVTLHQPLTPFSDDEWELYHVAEDPNELHDLSAQRPELRQELADAWEAAAWEQRIYPLDEGAMLKYLLRPERSNVYAKPVTIVAGTPTLERWRSVQLLWFRSCRISVALDFSPGDHGYLVAHGDQGAGYGLYVLDDELVFVHNDGRGRMRTLSGGLLEGGTGAVTLDLDAAGDGCWSVALSVEGAPRGTLEGVPMLFGMAPFEGIDVGIDRRSPVSWGIYERFGTFAYTGDLTSVRYEPGEPALNAPERMLDTLREMGARFE